MLKNVEVINIFTTMIIFLFFFSPTSALSLPIKCTTPREAYTILFKKNKISLLDVGKKLIGTSSLNTTKLPTQIAGKNKGREYKYLIYFNNFAKKEENFLEIRVKHDLKKISILYPLNCFNKSSLDYKIFF